MLKRLWSRQLGLLLTGILATGAILGVYAAGALDRWEGDAIDLGFQVRGERVPTDVAVVAVDDKTLTSARWRWPFPRSVHGRLVDRLHAAGVREIVYDVQFTERTKDKPWEDLALYDALGNAGGAVLATSETDRFGHSNVLGGDENLRRIHARAGAAALVSERGGVTRRIPLADGGLRSLSVAAAERLRVPVAMDAFGTHGDLITSRARHL